MKWSHGFIFGTEVGEVKYLFELLVWPRHGFILGTEIG